MPQTVRLAKQVLVSPIEDSQICSLHGNAILPVCGECRRGLEIRRRLMQLEKTDQWLSQHPQILNWGVAAILGVLAGVALFYGL